ncbi:hypothetical protein DYB35_009578 [Aphanomyces astaci]|uniref:Poly [ADP-ribose] polymerase n=1 Tax=Aphanomyces astaci TaxID=112090 RepID=A0A3R6Y0L6_APHAT|nr:hypothetical protein DYB35_009578 [Aphanomyces astaci]
MPAPTMPTPTSSPAIARPLDEVYSRSLGASSASVVGDYDVMLNQVAITASTSNNKFYRIQLIQQSPNMWNVYSRWGRVGEDGVYRLWGPMATLEDAKRVFCQKFKDKSKNNWADRYNFVPKQGAYEMVELDEKAAMVSTSDGPKVIGDDSVPSQLAPPTQKLIRMIFDKAMFKSELVRMQLDPKRMPLGTLSINQIQKGVAVLDTLRDFLDAGQVTTSHLQTLSAKFYQLIPHAYSRSTIPPVLNTPQQLEQKYEMLSTLHDIVVAQDVEKALGDAAPTAKHSLDLKYAELNAGLDVVTPDDPLHEVILQYVANTKGTGGGGFSCHASKLVVQDIWAVRRTPEDQSFSSFDSTPNHRLLWHGTNVAVVAAILKSGLRIMPSSGGRVGKGIYLANMLEKSKSYVRPTHVDGHNIGCLFLVEAALGKMHEIRQDDSRLTKAPAGYDSVLAKGTLHPNPDEDRIVQLDGQDVRVNVGRPVTLKNEHSSFHHDEYLVYQECQQRLRYIITFKM